MTVGCRNMARAGGDGPHMTVGCRNMARAGGLRAIAQRTTTPPPTPAAWPAGPAADATAGGKASRGIQTPPW